MFDDVSLRDWNKKVYEGQVELTLGIILRLE
jgi:hypothetical protein